MIEIEMMKDCIEEWFGQALSYEDLAEIYYTVRSEADKQFLYMAKEALREAT